jgi:hypothetical protein
MVPPDFFGEPAAGSTPNMRWIQAGTFATQGDCEAAKGSANVQLDNTIVDPKKETSVRQHTTKKIPGDAVCVPAHSLE